MPDETDEPKGTLLFRVLFSTFLIVVATIAAFAYQKSDNNVYVLIGAMAGVILQPMVNNPEKTRKALGRLRGIVSGRQRMIAFGAAGVLVLTVAVVSIIEITPDEICPHATELRVLTSPEGLQAIREVTEAYARATADDGCPTVFPYVYAAGAASVGGALARGWVDSRTEHPLIDFGPRPDVWLPDSTVDVRKVREILAKTLPPELTANGRLVAPLRDVTSVASSPIVLAGPAAARDETATLPGLVEAVLARPRPTLAAADPESSAAGLLASAGYLQDERTGLVGDTEARRREQIIAGSTPSSTDEVSLLCSYLRRGQTPAAVLTSLRTWRRMVAGKPLGPGCPDRPASPPDADAAPPVLEGPALDLPFVRFTWSGTRHAEAADGLLTWLLSDNARPQLSQAGLDPPLPGCTPLERNACVPIALNEMLRVHLQAKLSGRVLLAVDSSGSMAARTGPGEATRFSVASQGVLESLGHLGPNDEFGLWTFPAQRGRRSPELVGLAPGTLPQRSAIAAGLRTARPAGATPLYATILGGLDEVAGGRDDKRIRALVVLTDGEDTSSDRTLKQMETEVRRRTGASGTRLYVIATGDARCEGAGGTENGLRLLTDAARGECLETSPGKADATMAQLFATLWGGR